jgi:AraC-like DNA-binding protein
MLFKEYLPHPQLSNLVERYWKFVAPPGDVDSNGQPFAHVFPPDGSCSLVFANMKTFGHKGIAFVGPTTEIREINVFPNSVNIGIRLKPGCSQWLNPVNPGEIVNSAIHYDAHDICGWQQEVLKILDIDFENAQFLDNCLLELLDNHPFEPDQRIQKAVNAVINTAGNITLPEIVAIACIGERQLQRLFKQQTGVTIKQFCQIRRLRKAVIDLHLHKKTYPEMVHDRGFTDQAHYYKSFKNVAGYSMEKFFDHISKIEHVLT